MPIAFILAIIIKSMPQFPITDLLMIYKQTRTGDALQYGSVPDYSNVNATISPTNMEIQTGEGGVSSFQLFEVFIWDITVQINNGDKLVSGNTEYYVSGSPNLYSNRFVQAIRTLAKQII